MNMTGHADRDTLVTVLVNELSVKLFGHTETGRQIKIAAIEQNLPIQVEFVLEERMPDGQYRIVSDDESVRLHDGLQFRAHPRYIVVTVNEQPVRLEGHEATGAQIKAAAIVQGVRIQQNFALQEELSNGTSRNVGDNDIVHLREHLKFTAIAPDDNS
jgi:hypothetical protein